MNFDNLNLPLIVASPQTLSPNISPRNTFGNPSKSIYKLDNNTQLSSRSRNVDVISITGSRFGVERMSVTSKTPVPNSDLSHRSARGPGTNPFSPRTNMTIKEYVKVSQNKGSEYGHAFYNTPSNEMLQKKIPYGKSDKDKNLSFAETI